MRRELIFVLIASSALLSAKASSQSLVLKDATLVETSRPRKGDNNEILGQKIVYSINCTLLNATNATKEDSVNILNAANWHVFDNGKLLEINEIRHRWNKDTLEVKLYGDFEGNEKLSVKFLKADPQNSVIVNIDEATVGKTK